MAEKKDVQSSEGSFYDRYRKLVDELGQEAVEESLEILSRDYGQPPLVSRVLSEDKEFFLAALVKNRTILHNEKAALDQKTVELVVIGVATAIRCDHCLEVHIKQAVKYGATREEILHAMVISSGITESASLATSLRKYRQYYAKEETKAGGGNKDA